MRWEGQTLDGADAGALPGLQRISGPLRTVAPAEFPGVRFHEVAARSALNEVPAASAVPFRWTVNPYRGCTHACVYCFARGSHAWLELDTGAGFDREIVVKVNVAEVLRRELARPSWRRAHVALGTNTDPYQRAEGRYRLMPGVLRALAEAGTPFSILTKGTLLRRDLPLIVAAAREVPVGLAVSLGVHDEELQASLEPGTPKPRARLELVAAIREAGLECGVLLAPVLPWLTDGENQLDVALSRLARAGATGSASFRCTCGPGHASGSSGGSLGSTRGWCRDTGSCTHAAPMCRPSTGSGCRSAWARCWSGTGSPAQRPTGPCPPPVCPVTRRPGSRPAACRGFGCPGRKIRCSRP